MPEDYEEFARWVEPSIRDHLLDEREMAHYLGEVEPFGLEEAEAERFLIELCVRRGVTVERFAVEKLRDLVRIAAGGGIVDAYAVAFLQRQGREWLRPAAPEEPGEERKAALGRRVDGLVAAELETLGAQREEELRQRIAERLRAAAADSRLDLDAGREIYRQTLREVAAGGGEIPGTPDRGTPDRDLVAVFHDARVALGVDFAEAPVPAPAEEIPPGSPAPAESMPHPSAGVAVAEPVAVAVESAATALETAPAAELEPAAEAAADADTGCVVPFLKIAAFFAAVVFGLLHLLKAIFGTGAG